MAEDIERTAVAVAAVLTLGEEIDAVDPSPMLVIDEVAELLGSKLLLVGQ